VNVYTSNSGAARWLKPGYLNDGVQVNSQWPESFYFQTPADTLLALSEAYPFITNPTLRNDLNNYLHDYFAQHFSSSLVRQIGWSGGQEREAMVLPPEVATAMNSMSNTSGTAQPQRIFYAAWKYARLFPSEAWAIYNAVRPALAYPPTLTTDTLVRSPFTYNDYIAGYRGFINLYDMANPGTDTTLRLNVESQLGTLLAERTQGFAKDHPWEGTADNPGGISVNNYVRKYNLARNFLYLTPELGQYMATSSRAADIQTAIEEYTYIGPLWFVARNENTFQEGQAHHLYDLNALFLAKSYISQQPRTELSKYVDAPAFAAGDLFYIRNLVAALQAP
jgi:hypothetical protein